MGKGSTTGRDLRGRQLQTGQGLTSPSATPVKVTISVLVALALLAFFLWRAPLGEVAGTLARVHLGWVAAAVACSLASYTLRALRWGAILQPLGRAPVSELMGCTAAGFATSTVLPGRVGELVRPLLLSRRTGLPAAGALASILTERLIDFATILVVFAAGVALAPERLAPSALPVLREAAGLAAAGLAVALGLVFLLLHLRAATVPRVVRLAPRRWQGRLASFLEHLLDGLEAVRSLRRLTLLVAWSGAVWGAAILQVEVLAKGFGLSLGVPASAVLMSVSVLGLAVPTPAGVGSFHAAIQFGLASLLGAGLADATAFAIAHHAVCFFPITFVGLAYLGAVGLRPSAAAKLTAGKGV